MVSDVLRFEAAVAAARKITRLYAIDLDASKALRSGEVVCLVVQAIQTYEGHRRLEGGRDSELMSLPSEPS